MTFWLGETSGNVVSPPGATYELMTDADVSAFLAEQNPALAEWLKKHPPAIRRVSGLVLVSVSGDTNVLRRISRLLGGFSRRLGWHGTLIFDPVFWVHDKSGSKLRGLFQPD